jgi:Predicted Zn-dependent peptidases
VMVEAGSNYEQKENNGVSHFLEHLCFKGTINRPSSKIINEELDVLGTQSNAFTGEEYTGYWAKAHYTKTEKILEIVSDLFLNPTIPAEEMEKEKGVIVEEINMYEDMPISKVEEVFSSLMYGEQPPGRSVAGTKENIKRMTREDIIKYRAQHYRSSATTVVVAGKISEKKVLAQIEKSFEKMLKGKPVKLGKVMEDQVNPAVKLFNKKTDQTHLVLGWRAFDRYNKKGVVLSLLSTILGGGMSSRLFQKMREELGVCYYVKSRNSASRTYGAFIIRAGVNNERVAEAIDGILTEVRKIVAEPVTEQELRKAKDYKIGNMFLGLESSDSWGDWFGFQELLHDKKIETPDELKAKIEAVTVKDIQKVAKEILRTGTLNLAMVGGFKEGDEKKYLELLKV